MEITPAERTKGRLWAALSYWGILLMLAAYFAQGKNRLVHYHLRQAVALVLFRYANLILLSIILKSLPSDFGNEGLILLDVFFVLSVVVVGTRNAWHGKLIPLPVFGEPFAEFLSKAWRWVRREAKKTQDSI
jgi:uncharacterized membrane protein